MLTIAYYFLQVVLCSGMMMGYYWLVLRNKRFHQYNRFYLLAAALLSWIVPLIKITWSRPVVISEQPQVMQFLSVVADNNSQIEQTISAQPVSAWSWDLLVTGIYFTVAAILLFGMITAFTRLYRLLRDHSCKNVGDVYLILTQAKGTPFSFFRYIFWNEEIDIRSEAGKQILQHELTHVQQKHSFDKLFIQVMLIGGWFNPFFWLLRKEMDMIHEFIADKKAVNNGDTASLAQMLLTAAYPQQQFALTHPFFFSPIKRRLQMLTNTKNPRYSYIRRLVVLPLLAIVIVLFAFRSKDLRENAEISVATVMENVATDQKQFFHSFLQGIDNYFDKKTTEQPAGIHSVFYNGRPLTVPTSFRLKDLSRMTVMPHLDKDHLDLVPAMNTASDPLYVIDGVKQVNKRGLDAFNPEDIHSINIWKGADAIAKYGDAGKDGVIEINTKSFAAGKRNAEGFSGLAYEAIAKDPLGNVAKNRVLYLKISVYKDETSKAEVWSETHVVQSNDNGAFSFTLGKDVRSSTKPEGEMEKLDWSNGPYFVNLGIAVAPSVQAAWWAPQDNYQDYGTTKMMTIPFLSAVTIKGYGPWKTYPRIKGRDVTIPANTTTIATIYFSGAQKGDQVYVRPNEDKVNEWAIYSAWVEEDGVIKVRLANYSDKPVFVAGSNYVLGLSKFAGPPSPNWMPGYAGVLIIVDGVEYKEELNTINQDNISSITVLKDARSIEKYGEAGKNGVLEITMKPQKVTSANNKNNGAANVQINTSIQPGPRDTYLTTDSSGNVNWRTLSGNLPLKKNPDTLVLVQGSKINASGSRTGTQVIPGRLSVAGYAMDNSPATIAIKNRNPDVKYIVWRDKTHISFQLKDDTEETYDISKPDSKKRAEAKYGKLPEVPEKVLNAPGPGSLNALTVPGTIVGGTFSGTLSARSIKNDETTVVGYGTRRPSEPAQFPGGLPAWAKYLERNLDEDVPLKKGAPPGRYTVIVAFDVSEDGEVSNVRAETDPGYGTREEAVRILAKGPRWKPATRDDKNVKNTHRQSIGFFVKDPKADADLKNTNLNLTSGTGKDVTIAPESMAVITVDVPGAQKGDPLLVTPQDDYQDWAVYSSWVSEANKVNVRFANLTKKEVKVLGSQYKIAVIKK